MARPTMPLLKGTLDVIILRTLGWGPAHGYAISRWIRQTTGDELQIEEGALYPALRRLEAKGWVAGEWRASDSNRRARYYRLTPQGRRALGAESESWRRYVEAVGWILETAPSPRAS